VLLRRYAPNLKWSVFLATEEPEHPVCKLLEENYNVKLLVLEKENSSFLSSRKRALELLPKDIYYVLPMQEDFLLERYIDEKAIKDSIDMLENDYNLVCVRYMPCPGPNEMNKSYGNWLEITKEYDSYGFTFQATLWKTNFCFDWYDIITEKVKTYNNIDRKKLEVDINIAENRDGQELFYILFKNRKQIGWKRSHKFSNAVYLSPWPYRPTAIIKKVLQPFAKELAIREGVKIDSQYLQ